VETVHAFRGAPARLTTARAAPAEEEETMTQNNPARARLRAACGATALVALTALALPAAAQDRVRIATNSFSLAHGPLALAVADASVFGTQGIEIDTIAIQGSSANCIAALLSRSVELCQVGTTTGTDAIAEGAELVGIAVLTGPINEIIISRAAAEATGIAPDAPVEQRAAALGGLRLVTAGPGSPHYMSLAAVLRVGGHSMDDITFRTLLDVPAMVESIRNGAIDGALWSVGSLGQLIESGDGVRWISMAQGDIAELSTLPYVTVYARTEWVNANRELVTRIHAGYAEGIRRLQEDGAESSRLIKERFFPDMDPALWEDSFAHAQGAYIPGAAGTRFAWNQFLDMQIESNPEKNYANAAFELALIPEARAD